MGLKLYTSWIYTGYMYNKQSWSINVYYPHVLCPPYITIQQLHKSHGR